MARLDRYFQDHLLGPLGMRDTSFRLSPAQRSRLSRVHARGEGGAPAPVDFALPEEPEFLMGGGGLYGTAPDYLAFARMLMAGVLDGTRILGLRRLPVAGSALLRPDRGGAVHAVRDGGVPDDRG